ncbi:hypothetical protein BLSTO_03921 [Blastocystis sp. subtype 1]
MGERKTVLVFSPEIVDESLLDQSIRSLAEVLQSPTNRLYLDIVLFSSYSSEMQETWKRLFATFSDCSIFFLPKTSDPWSSQLNSYLEGEHIEQLIFVTQPVRFALDALEYAAAASYILWNDLSLYCVSLYNDIATTPLSLQPQAVERRDVSAGTAVLLTSSLLRHHLTELADLPFDEWIAFPAVRRARFCLTPEVSRVYPLVRRKLPFVTTEALELRESELFVPFLEMDFRYLYRGNYEKELVKVLSEAVVIQSVTHITGARKGGVYRVVYDEGKALGKQVFNLLCSRTLLLRSYQETDHPQLRCSAYFSIYLCLFKDGEQLLLPGILVLSMTYFSRVRPIITLDKKGKILELNHAIVRSDNIVDTPLLRGWNENSSLEEVYHDIVNQLQGDPFVYEKEEEKSPEIVEEKPVLPAVVGMSCGVDFDPNIPYASLVKGKKLGAGAFATVYEVEYKGMLCAMKEWKRALSEYEQTALDREISIQKALRHPNCTRLYGVSRTGSGLPVLVMEKADGCLIDYTTKKKGPRLSNAEKCRIILEIAQGLEYIHSLNCVHRDIKVVVVEWSDV